VTASGLGVLADMHSGGALSKDFGTTAAPMATTLVQAPRRVMMASAPPAVVASSPVTTEGG